MKRESWEYEPRYVERQCVDCPATFEREIHATKQVRCAACSAARKRARLAVANRRNYARYKVTPPPSWYKNGRAA